MSNAAVEVKPTPPAATTTTSQSSWLALTLTPGLGPTRAKRLVEFFGSVEAVFNASLTELEAAELPATSAQALGTGKSVELAHEKSQRLPLLVSDSSPSMIRPIRRAFAKSTILH